MSLSHPITIGDAIERRRRLAELELLESFDRLRQTLGHDYGSGQRGRELSRYRRELDVYSTDELKIPIEARELWQAFERIGVGRLRRARLQPQGDGSPRTIRAWEELSIRIHARMAREVHPGVDPWEELSRL